MLKQGEIYWADLDPIRGREQRGRRPVLVVSRNEINRLPLTVFVMIGTSAKHVKRRFRGDIWVCAEESGLAKDSVFLGLQMRSLEPTRLTQRIGSLPEQRIPEVWDAVRFVVGDDRG